MFTETVIEVWLVTSACPVSSVIMPRTAGTTIVLCLVHLRRVTCTAWCRAPAGTTAARRGRRAGPGRPRTGRAAARSRERGDHRAHPHRTAAAAGDGACATGDGRAAATRPTATRCTSCPGGAARGRLRRNVPPRPPTPEPMTVRGRLGAAEPAAARRACRGRESAGAAEPEPRSQPRDGERRRASGVPAPDSADTPDGADRAARASPADRAGTRGDGGTRGVRGAAGPVREPARARARAPARVPARRPAAPAPEASPGTVSAPLASRRGRRATRAT